MCTHSLVCACAEHIHACVCASVLTLLPIHMQGASYDRVYKIYVVTFWLRSAQERDPQCEAGWEQYSDGGRKYKYPRINSYVNYVDELCSWYEPPSKGADEL